MSGSWCFFGHAWDTPTVVFTEPLDSIEIDEFHGSRSVLDDLFNRAMLGVSTLTQHCRRCGAVNTSQVAGDARRPT